IHNPKLEDEVRVSFAGSDINAVRVRRINGNGAASQAGTGEARGIDVKCIHQRAPTGGPVIGSEDATVGRPGVQDLATRNDRQTGNPPTDGLVAHGLAVQNDTWSQRQPILRARDNRGRWGGSVSPSRPGRGGSFSFLVFLEYLEPGSWTHLGQYRFTFPRLK